MNGYQRVLKALHFEPVDRVAIIPELIQHNLEVAGKTPIFQIIWCGLYCM